MASDQPIQSPAPTRRSSAVRQAGPLLAVVAIVVFITFTILPSSLNLPQSNPTTVLEYAPIPPEDDSPPPISSAGGLSSLGLAGSGTLTSALPPPPPSLKKKLPPVQRQKRCVGGRQTEDPNSPPCQSYFEGDNGGNTWLGVTGDEITVVFAIRTSNTIDQGQGTVEPSPASGTYCDVDLLDCDTDPDTDPDENAHIYLRIANAFSRYFNTRYQTYGRHVHLHIYYTGASSASAARGDAADNYDRLQPFAAILDLGTGFTTEYISAMAQNESMVFGALQGEPRSYFQRHAPKVWSYWPDTENWADSFTSYVCTKAGPNSKVNHAGAPYPGQPRVYGLLSTRDPGFQAFHHMKNLTAAGLGQCGINIKVEKSFRQSGFWFDNRNRGQDRAEAAQNMAAFQDADVNTIIWAGGSEVQHSEAGAAIGYFPEIIVAGDADMDGRGFASRQQQDFWHNAWAHSNMIPDAIKEKTPGYQAYKEAEPNGTDYNWAINQYRQYFMLFFAIQVAGPKIAPPAVDAGMHAIQRRESTGPYLASCWFHPGDFSCVKDFNEMYYDKNGQDPNGNVGCYRLVRGGLRYAADRWGQALGAGIDVPGYRKPAEELCTGYAGTGVFFQPAA